MTKDEKNKTRSADPIFEFFRDVHIIQHLSQARMEKALPGGMLQSHFGVLSHLVRSNESKSPATLADIFQVSRPSMTNTLNKLEKMRFVKVLPDASDGRAKRVVITSAGIAAQQQAIQAIAPLFADIVKAVGVEAFQKLLPEMNRIRQFLDEHR